MPQTTQNLVGNLIKNIDNNYRSGYPTGNLPDSGYDVYILTGQSNMIGRATLRAGIDDDYSAIAGKVFQYGYDSHTVTPATNPLDHYNEIAGSMGLWLEFAKSKLNTLYGNRKILLVPSARGGTSFAANQWNPPSDSCYTNMISRSNEAMALSSGGQNVLKQVLWLQGESDADAGASAALAHRDNMQILYNAMKANITGMTANTPFICGSIRAAKPQANVINAGLQVFAGNNPSVKYVSLVDQTYIDSDHYTAESLAVAGQRFGSAA